MTYYIKSMQLTKEQTSSQAKNQMGPDPTMNGKTGDITIDKNKAPSMNQFTFSQARDSEETAVDTRSERSKNVGCQNKMTEGIDPVILQRVANALEYKNVYSRSSDFDKNLVRTLKAIENKHGDITKDCLLESDCMKTLVLIGICNVVQDLQKKRLVDLDVSILGSYYTAVRDAENMKVNVQWLHNRLGEIKDAVNFSSEAIGMENERIKRLAVIDRKKKELVLRRVELERIKSEVRAIEESIAQEAVMVDELDRKYCDQMSRISQFQKMNLMDGLL